MKNFIFLIAMAVFGYFESNAAVPKHHSVASVALDTIQVGFEKDTTVIEGDSVLIAVRLLGEIPKDSTVVVKYTIKTTDATTGNDFMFRGGSSFTFRASDAAIQKQYFELLTKRDNNEERESITLELAIVKGGKITKITKGKYVITLKDFKTPSELAQEKFKEESQSIVKNVQRIIDADKDTTEVIGSLKLLTDKVVRYHQKYDKPNPGYKEKLQDSLTKMTFDLARVEVEFKNGVAAEIRAFLKDSNEVFSNYSYKGIGKPKPRYGVSFRHSNYDNYYLISNKDSKNYIKLADVVQYNHVKRLNFAPNNTSVVLDTVGKPKNLFVAASLNSYLHFNIYTDLLGLLRTDQGNGIIQTEASAKIFLSTLPHKNRLHFSFNYLMPYVRYARFENGFETIPTTMTINKTNTKSDTIITIDKMLVNQRKYLDVGLKLNIVNWLGRFDNTYELNTFVGFGWFDRRGPIDIEKTKIIGSTQYQGILTNLFEWGLEGRASIIEYRNFGINLGAMIAAQKLLNNKNNTITNGGLECYYRAEWEVFFFPLSNKQGKIFLRNYYTFNTNEKDANFLRVQFGYKAKFNFSNKK